MSDIMLFGVLRMPYEMAMADELSRFQFYGRAQEAADRLEATIAQLEAVQEAPTSFAVQLSQRSLQQAGFASNATAAALQQPVQAAPDGARWKMILKLLSTFKLDYYFLEGRSEEEITSAIDEEIGKEATIEAVPGEPGQ